MENLGDGLRSEIDRVRKLTLDPLVDWIKEIECDDAEEAIKACNVVRMHERYETLKQWK